MQDYYCDVRDKTIKIKSKSKHLRRLTQNEFDKRIQMKHSVENPVFFDIDELIHEYIINHKNKFDFYFVICDFELVFDNSFYPHIKSDLKKKEPFFN